MKLIAANLTIHLRRWGVRVVKLSLSALFRSPPPPSAFKPKRDEDVITKETLWKVTEEDIGTLVKIRVQYHQRSECALAIGVAASAGYRIVNAAGEELHAAYVYGVERLSPAEARERAAEQARKYILSQVDPAEYEWHDAPTPPSKYLATAPCSAVMASSQVFALANLLDESSVEFGKGVTTIRYAMEAANSDEALRVARHLLDDALASVGRSVPFNELEVERIY